MIRKSWVLGGSVLVASAVGCGSSSTTTHGVDGGTMRDGEATHDGGEKKDSGGSHHDAGHDAGKTTKKDSGGEKDSGKGGSKDSGHGTKDTGVDASVGRHLLVTYDGTGSTTAPSTMFAVNMQTHAIDGTIHLQDSQAITDTSNIAAPFMLEQSLDVVSEIDPLSWSFLGSWSVATSSDGGTADPYAVSVATESKVYVVRYDVNQIDVLDISTATDAGKATSNIDLSSLAQPQGDGVVHASAAAYDPTSKLLYVVLQNININDVVYYQGSPYTVCPGTVSSLIAIDTTSDTVQSLGGAAPGGGIALKGYDPQSLFYDKMGARLLLVHAGCNGDPTSDGGMPGALKQAGVEEINLSTHATDILLDTSTVPGFPGSFVVASKTAAAIGFNYPTAVYFWDPSTKALGKILSKDLMAFDYDGNGNLVGAAVIPAVTDGGAATTNIVSVSMTDGTVTPWLMNVIPLGGYGYPASAGVWPRY
jgi:hypothetical protein